MYEGDNKCSKKFFLTMVTFSEMDKLLTGHMPDNCCVCPINVTDLINMQTKKPQGLQMYIPKP